MSQRMNGLPKMAAPTGDYVTQVRSALHAKGMRWTPQRRIILDVLLQSAGDHVTGAALVEQVQARDPETPPSTIYRTLDVLESIGYVCHSHGRDGREEFHVLPGEEHAHLLCNRCGTTWEIPPAELTELVASLNATRRFRVDLSHLTVSGTCPDCAEAAPA